MREIYLDNCATTRTDSDIAQAALEIMTTNFGNPSSLHKKGLEAQLLLDQARGRVASALGCEPEEVYFTSGGTESNNLAILGAYRAHRRRASGFASVKTEHASVLGALGYLSERGADVILTDPGGDGAADPEALIGAVDENTLLLSCGLVNNEVGGVAGVGEIAKAAKAKSKRLLLHCDAVQAFGKIPVNVNKLGVDMLSVSGHKLHAPKGIGALYIRKGVRIRPLMYGGGQERTVRPGTESVALACAFGAAVEKIATQMSRNFEKYKTMREYFLKRAENVVGLCINSAPETTPYICNISVPGYRSETMVHHLAGRGVYVSGGSACAKGSDSHVLTAMGLPRERIQSALRISFCKDNAEADIEAFFEALEEGISKLARSKA